MHNAADDELFAIITDTDRPALPLRVLKQGDTFAVFDERGDIVPDEAGQAGVYHDGTRFLSRFELALGRRRPLLLSSTISRDNTVFTADLTNPDILVGGQLAIARGELHLFRARILWDGHCLERIRLSSFARQPLDISLFVHVDADFADVFEVRGTRRAHRGLRRPDVIADSYVMPYIGLDGVERRSILRWETRPGVARAGLLTYVLHLEPLERVDLHLTVTYEREPAKRITPSFDAVHVSARSRVAAGAEHQCRVTTSNPSTNCWIDRSAADLQMMITDTTRGPYPYAGIPWFSAPFGRDGLIAARALLWAAPDVASGVLSFLSATQATHYSDEQDAQPGKIVHEMRGGEMAALGEIPFGRYYGSVDATPLFVMVAADYYQRTADLAFIDAIWPNILAALEWMRSSGDPDGDGFIEYARRSSSGLVQQGWKDSHDSIFHRDGTLAAPPIALCEVQGYAYAAWKGAARLAAVRGEQQRADEWQDRAARLQMRFEEAFWCEELGTYAIALDGSKRRCEVRSSNPGHCLFTGIATPAHARRVGDTLMEDSSFAGWGIRTVSAGEARYNPMSYHNGSIWPHDNALAAAGLARYGMIDGAIRIFGGMLDLSQAVDLQRLPELLCGFHRRDSEHPTLYPVACAPQSWAATAVFQLLEACLGLDVDAVSRRVSFSRGRLPDHIDWMHLSNLTIGDARLNLRLERHPHDLGVTVLSRHGEIDVVGLK